MKSEGRSREVVEGPLGVVCKEKNEACVFLQESVPEFQAGGR